MFEVISNEKIYIYYGACLVNTLKENSLGKWRILSSAYLK